MFVASAAPRRIAALGLAMALLLPASAHAGPWATAFDSPAVAAHVDADQREVLVVAAGPRRKAAQAAAADLRAGLKGVATRLRDGKSLGALGELDDEAIAAKAQPLGADRIAIVRVYDEGEDAEAIVTIYDAEGRSVGGFTARPGEAVAAPDVASSHDQDVADAISGLDTEHDEAELAFEKRRIMFDESLMVTSNGNGMATVSRRFHPMTGEGRALSGAEFYRYVGRDDLAQKFTRRRAARIGVATGSVVTSVAGLGLMFGYGIGKAVAAANRTCDDDSLSAAYMQCEDDKSADTKRALKIGLGGGTGLLLGGIALAIVAGKIDPHPVAGSEALGLARSFNDRLREELGLPKRRPDVSRTVATPVLGPDAMGMQIAGRF